MKGLAEAKSRLAPDLAPDERERLVLRLFDRVLSALDRSRGIHHCLVVSPDTQVLDLATGRGCVGLNEARDESSSLAATTDEENDVSYNRALELARVVATTRWRPAALLVVAADLPYLTSDDVDRMLALGAEPSAVVIAPDRQEVGTNALFLRPPEAIPFRFGTNSFQNHGNAARARGLPLQIYRAPGTAVDVDLPEDLAVSLR